MDAIHDVGSGAHPRFITSNTKLFNNEKVEESVEYIFELCNTFTERIKSNSGNCEILHLVSFFATKCSKIDGIGPIRSQMVV